ncbi:hypothetical protein C2S52_006749 [Perilla frutescens var. hirtella]|nr:hypothetical protein C2S52_006749 [Perilla frutescens var. hirtella]
MKSSRDVLFGSNLRQRPTSGSKNERKDIFDACDKPCRDMVNDTISNFFYDDGIPFYVATVDSYKEMVEEIRIYDPTLVLTIMYELRVPLLKKKVDNINLQILEYKKEWAIKGCSILSDRWRDSVVHKKIINFLINSPKGLVFLKSVNISDITKDSVTLLTMLDNIIKEVGVANVIQVVTDNASNYVKAGKLIMVKRLHLYWTPCAAHCLDLMLDDICKDQECPQEVHFHE